ncbi:unnamed protein product [Rotaria sordida]|uniref:AN1-type zinc finger protein 4 n=1 Tax=Rotaria sordida TaxID=392033 RepID=A0A818N4C2_9BILA|nr:unnamed protein product [Rotaria sordida]CAF3576705.1 unnamed protein product [Rotaria sordida]CAF3600362.1 unnamed protein product [Rotaria sordida]
MLPTSQTPPLPTQRTLIPINIETLAGTSFELLVSPYEQIQSIKRKIERREGIPIPHQHLIWKTNELDDESCLNDYNIDAGTTIKLVLAMRGGPVNTKRVPIEDSFIRDMSEYIESSQDDYGIGNDLLPSSNKNVTFLVLRDGDQFNFFQVIDRGDGTLSPLSGSMSAASMYNTHETITVETERQYDEKRQADDRKTKQKMELIRSKLKTHARKDIFLPPRPPSSSKKTKSNFIHHHHHHHHPRRSIHVETNSNLSINGDNSSGTSSLEQQQQQQQQHRSLSYSFPANFFNTYNLLSSQTTTTANLNRNDLLHEEDSEDDDDDDSHDDDDDDDEQRSPLQQQIFTSRSFSPSVFYSKKRNHHQHNTTKKLLSQETATTTTTTTAATVNDTSSNAVLVDYIHHISPTLPIVSTSLRTLSETKYHNISDEPLNINDKNHIKNDIHYQHSRTSPMLELNNNEIISPININRKQTADIQSRNDTSLSKPIWTDDDEQINVSDEYNTPGERTSTSQSILFRHQNSSTSTTALTPIPTLPHVNKKSSLPSTTQQFYHHHKSINNEQQSKPSPRSLIPLTVSKYRRIPTNVHLTTSTQQQQQQQTFMNSSNDLIQNGNINNSTDSFNEHLMLNKRIEILKTPGKQQSSQSTAPSPSSSSNTVLPPAPPPSLPSKRNFQQKDIKPISTTTTVPTSSSSLLPMDSTKVTIETIGPKTVSALLRQNATIEPVDTSRGVGKHLVSLLTTASKETASLKTGYKQSSRDAIIEERYKLDSKLNNPWSNTTNHNLLTTNNNLQSNTTTIYNTNKLPPVIVNRKSTSKCFLCKKKTGLATTYQCRCGSSFCSEHRYPEAHACAFDYKAEGKRLIERNNPLITAPKLPKI